MRPCCALQAAAPADSAHAAASQPVDLAAPAGGAAGVGTAPPGARQQPGNVVSPAAAPAPAQTQVRPSGDNPAAALDGLEPQAVKQLLTEVQTLHASVCIVIVSFSPRSSCGSHHRRSSVYVPWKCSSANTATGTGAGLLLRYALLCR